MGDQGCKYYFVSFKRAYVLARHHTGWPEQILVRHQQKQVENFISLKIPSYYFLAIGFHLYCLLLLTVNSLSKKPTLKENEFAIFIQLSSCFSHFREGSYSICVSFWKCCRWCCWVLKENMLSLCSSQVACAFVFFLFFRMANSLVQHFTGFPAVPLDS